MANYKKDLQEMQIKLQTLIDEIQTKIDNADPEDEDNGTVFSFEDAKDYLNYANNNLKDAINALSEDE